ncbi:MAG: M12 family metallo-peptidase [Chitinophagales bacterium]
MKNFLKLAALFACSLLSVSIFAQTAIERKIAAIPSFQPTVFWNPTHSKNEIAETYAYDYSVFQAGNGLPMLLTAAPQHITFDASLHGKKYEFLLTRNTEIYSPDFSVRTSGENNFNPNAKALYYHGTLRGIPGSVAAISFFENDIVGIISTPDEGNFVIGKLGDINSTDYIFYNERFLKISNPFRCNGALQPQHLHKSDRSVPAGPYSCKTIRLYYETDSLLYKSKSKSVTNVVNFVTSMFNSIATLYLNEGLHVQLSQVYVWTTKDPYSITDAGDALNLFSSMRGSSFNGDLAQLLSVGPNSLGGLAWLDVLCGFQPESYVNIGSSFNTFPTYSWNIEAMSHETGHNLGSEHTHNCDAWVGGPIDWCAPTYNPSYIEGACTTGPLPTKGTVMSYCHLLGTVGINLSLGFGPQPGNKIRSNVAGASCLGAYPEFTAHTKSDTALACNGDSIAITLDSANSHFTYQWYRNGAIATGATSKIYTVGQTGTYSCVLTTADGCTANSDDILLNFIKPNAQITPSSAQFCHNDSVQLTSSSVLTSYFWSNGDTSRSTWIKTAGNYNLTVMDGYGCTETSNTISVTEKTCFAAGINDAIATTIWSANPVGGQLVISGCSENSMLIFYDLCGRKISMPQAFESGNWMVQTASLPQGIYIATLVQNETRISRRIIKD